VGVRVTAFMVTDTFDLSGRIAVVTGGSRGIGRAIALGLAEAGATVVPTARSADDVRTTVDRIEAVGGEGLAETVDVADPDSVASLFDRVDEELGGADVVVNNAGINPGNALGTPDRVDAEGFDTVTDVNLRGAYLCARSASDHLQADGGSVVNVASVGGLVGLPRQHPYVASKHGLVGLTKSLAIDWAPDVRVNCLAPGYVATDLTEDLQSDDDLREAILRQTPLDRFADPEEIAAPAVFLASDAASYVTGSVLTADGGWTAR
jgi:NAD(P)-dependent dehydrogenase (short-subunit alcohol dehydrogenase family)